LSTSKAEHPAFGGPGVQKIAIRKTYLEAAS
jgi:hypothetical protein